MIAGCFSYAGLVVRLRGRALAIVIAGLALMFQAAWLHPARADIIKHPRAIFSGLDKITSRIISFEVAIDETVQFGSLQITPRACYTRPATEAPQTTSFIEVDEIDTSNQYKRIFSGWIYADSPGLNGIEHPVYDVWLNDCKGGTAIIASTPETQEPLPDAGLADVPAKPDLATKPRRAPPTATLAPPAVRRQPTQRFFPTNPNGGFRSDGNSTQ